MRRASAFAGFSLLVVACTTTTKPVEPARPEPIVAASAAPKAVSSTAPAPSPSPAAIDTSGWAKDWPKTWTDARAVDALVARCDFDPPPSPVEDEMSTPADLLRCKLAWSQSCSPDVCGGTSMACENGCMSTCGSCSGACTTTCSSCKAACKDDACLRRCAQETATCKQTCNTTLDKCASADCSKAYDACNKRVRASFKANNCPAKCVTFERCRDACSASMKPQTPEAERACQTRCENALSPGFNKCMDACAAFDGDPSGKAAACHAKCQEEPCTPFVCMMRQELFGPRPQ